MTAVTRWCCKGCFSPGWLLLARGGAAWNVSFKLFLVRGVPKYLTALLLYCLLNTLMQGMISLASIPYLVLPSFDFQSGLFPPARLFHLYPISILDTCIKK